ncbi:MAG: hypothetical protein M5U01_22220 [Ardenticatenaceae bacterium]|nr:hypothetical protein [Ardenticatenaceae bacterium]
MHKHRSPHRLVLDMLMLLILGLLVRERRLFAPPGHHLFAQLGLIVLVYGLLALWLLISAPAFPIDEPRDQDREDEPYGAEETARSFTPRQLHYRHVMVAEGGQKKGGRIRIWRPRDGA